jgi:hypothetical protein
VLLEAGNIAKRGHHRDAFARSPPEAQHTQAKARTAPSFFLNLSKMPMVSLGRKGWSLLVVNKERREGKNDEEF